MNNDKKINGNVFSVIYLEYEYIDVYIYVVSY